MKTIRTRPDIQVLRVVGEPFWSKDRFEATKRIGLHAWLVGYGRTQRQAVANIGRTR